MTLFNFFLFHIIILLLHAHSSECEDFQFLYLLPGQRPQGKVSSVEHQFEEWELLYKTFDFERYTIHHHFPEIQPKIIELYKHVGGAIRGIKEKEELLDIFYHEDKEMYELEQFDLIYFNASNLRLACLLNGIIPTQKLIRQVFPNLTLLDN